MIEQTHAPMPNPSTEAAPQYQPAQPAPVAKDPLRRSPFVAAALSIMPGLGQVYLGYYQLGFVNAIVICVLLTLLASQSLGSLVPLASVFMAFFWLYNIVDAGRRALLVNESLTGRATSLELPKDFASPGMRGSVMGGAVLVAIGLVLLSRTLWGLSLEWVEDWWPAAIVLFGGYLIFKAKSDPTSSSSAAPEEE